MYSQPYIGCPSCDLLHRRSVLPHRGVATCSRCGAMLYRDAEGCVDFTLAMSLAALICFVIANAYPFLSMRIEGRSQEMVLISGVIELFHQGMNGVALLALATGVVFPLLELIGLIFILIPLKLGRQAWGTAPIFRIVRALQPWSMAEVFLLGILVAVVKLTGMAQIFPGTGMVAFLFLVVLMTSIAVSLHPECIWAQLPVRQ